MKATINYLNEDWKVLSKFFPEGWEEQSRSLGALTRMRSVSSVSNLLQIFLIHLADGHSLRETVAIAKRAGIADLSDVALLKRLRSSSEWFRWMSLKLLNNRGIEMKPHRKLARYSIKSIDASVITEPGSTGTNWRLHYSLNLFGLDCDQFIITQPSTGESFLNFKIDENDLLIADRAYGNLQGMKYVKEKGGEFIVRYRTKSFTLTHENKEFDLLKALRELKPRQIKEWNLTARTRDSGQLNLRICAIKKSKKAAEQAIKKARKVAIKKQKSVSEETLEMQKYVIIATSLPEEISAKLVLELYRCRWQVEIAFKRLKSILGLGHLPKFDEQSSKAWLHGKIFTALLSQAIVDQGRLFSPWGYPL